MLFNDFNGGIFEGKKGEIHNLIFGNDLFKHIVI